MVPTFSPSVGVARKDERVRPNVRSVANEATTAGIDARRDANAVGMAGERARARWAVVSQPGDGRVRRAARTPGVSRGRVGDRPPASPRRGLRGGTSTVSNHARRPGRPPYAG